MQQAVCCILVSYSLDIHIRIILLLIIFVYSLSHSLATIFEMSRSVCFKVDLAFDGSGSVNQENIQKITSIICAMLNTSEGQLDVCMENFDKKTIHELIRKIEQRFKDAIGGLASSEKIEQQLVMPQKITFVVKPLDDYLCTLNYNLFLPSMSATKAQIVAANEPISAIERIIDGKQGVCNDGRFKFGDHRREFKMDEAVETDFLLCPNVVCKPLKGRNVECEITNKRSKFQSQVSALANDIGGHIYHGIKNGKVVGVHVKENTFENIISAVEKVLVERLVWGGDDKPQRKREWDICLEPVKNKDDCTIEQIFIIVVSIAPYKGGVFVEEPECYHVVQNNVEKMPFNVWREELLRRRTIRQCKSVDEHIKSILNPEITPGGDNKGH